MGNNRGCLLPSHTSDVQLPSDFSDFFTTKVSMFRDSLCPEDTPDLVTPLDGDVQVTLDSFFPTTNEEIIGIIESSLDKSCNLDLIPTWLLKSCTRELAPVIVAIVNRYFETSHVPVELKRAHIRPRLKKHLLILNNYRPVIVPFVSKIICTNHRSLPTGCNIQLKRHSSKYKATSSKHLTMDELLHLFL